MRAFFAIEKRCLIFSKRTVNGCHVKVMLFRKKIIPHSLIFSLFLPLELPFISFSLSLYFLDASCVMLDFIQLEKQFFFVYIHFISWRSHKKLFYSSIILNDHILRSLPISLPFCLRMCCCFFADCIYYLMLLCHCLFGLSASIAGVSIENRATCFSRFVYKIFTCLTAMCRQNILWVWWFSSFHHLYLCVPSN